MKSGEIHKGLKEELQNVEVEYTERMTEGCGELIKLVLPNHIAIIPNTQLWNKQLIKIDKPYYAVLDLAYV